MAQMEKMDEVDEFLEEPSMEKLGRLRKSDLIRICEKLDLNVQKATRKDKLIRVISEYVVDENIFEEVVLGELSSKPIKMTPEKVELEKARIQAQMELEKV